jgi:gluconokinase
VVILLMGVSGAGKSTVGARLAERLGWAFHDADDLHSEENIQRMRSGRPLDDDARAPWLEAVRAVIERVIAQGEDAVVACSALKEQYRDRLLSGLDAVRVVHLVAPADVLEQRLARRHGHFMPAGLLESQLATLEPPSGALVLNALAPVESLVDEIAAAVQRA